MSDRGAGVPADLGAPGALSPDARALLAPWPGPCGGLPPFDRATPAALAEALPHAVAARRRAVRTPPVHPESVPKAPPRAATTHARSPAPHPAALGG